MVEVTQDILETLTERIVQAVHPEQIYLFGSRAVERCGADSDVDLLIVVRADRSKTLGVSERARGVVGDIGCGVDIVTCTVEDFQHRASWPSTLEATVKRSGRLLYG